VSAIGGPAVDLSTVAMNNFIWQLVTSINSATTGAAFNSVTGTFSAATGGIMGSTGTAFQVGSSNATISYAPAINSTTGKGVDLTSNTGSTISFTGTLTLSSGSNTAFNATGGGTVTATDASSTLTTTTGTALNVANTTIGASGLKFQSISANGAANGIVLNTTGAAGSLTVTGTGAADSGGIIQNTTGDGVLLTSTRSPSFTRMKIQSTGGSGISGTQVTNFTFANGTITGSGNAVMESNIAFLDVAGTGNNLSGVVSITNSTFTTAFDSGIDIRQGDATVSDLTITGNTFTSSTSTTTSKGSGISITLKGTATTVGSLSKALINSNTVTNFPSGAGIKVIGGNGTSGGTSATLGVPSSGNVITITNNTIQGQVSPNQMGTNAIETAVSGEGQGNFNISNNGTAGTPLTNFKGVGVALSAFGHANVTGTISNNVIVANNINNSSGISSGVDQTFGINDAPTLAVTISNNNVSGMQGNGILSGARNSKGTANIKIQNNTIGTPTAGARPGIRVDAGTPAVGSDTSVCLNISGNTTSGSGSVAGIGLRKEGTNPTVDTFQINGMAATSSPGVEQYVGNTGQNPGTANGVADGSVNGVLLLSATSGFGNCSLP
jgi:hypothetical protein